MALLAEMLRKRPIPILAAVCASILTIAAELYWNAQLSELINRISTGDSLSAGIITPALFTMFGISAASYGKGYLSGFACEHLSHDLRMGYARYFASLSVAEAENLRVGEQLSGLQNEIADVSGYLNTNLFQLLDDGIKFTVTLVWLLFLNPALTLAIYLPVLLTMAYVFQSSKIIRSAAEGSQRAKGRMNGTADILLTLFPVIRLYDAACLMLEHYKKEEKDWEYQTVRSERIRARLMSLSALFSCIPLVLLFFTGGSMVINGTLTVGGLYLFLNLSGNVSGVMMNIPGFIAAFRQFSVNMERLSPHILLEEKRRCA